MRTVCLLLLAMETKILIHTGRGFVFFEASRYFLFTNYNHLNIQSYLETYYFCLYKYTYIMVYLGGGLNLHIVTAKTGGRDNAGCKTTKNGRKNPLFFLKK